MEFKNDLDNNCGFHVEKKGEFCSPSEIVDKLSELAEVKNSAVKNPKDEKTILENLKKKYACSDEICILKKADIPNALEIINENFKPEGPANTFEWLSNIDIDKVLTQIEKKYINKKFLHIPYQMIDFEKTKSILGELDWPAKYNEGYRTFGTVVNTDTSQGRGIHWFAIFGSFQDSDKEFTIEYFNSSGEPPYDEIMLWMKKSKHKWQYAFEKPIKDIIVTRIVNQIGDNQCGVYSLYYIISRLNDTKYMYFKHNKIGDKTMDLFRKYLFREKK